MLSVITVFLICSAWSFDQTAPTTPGDSSPPQDTALANNASAKPTVYRVPADYAFFSAERTQLPTYPSEAASKNVGGRVILLVQYSTEGNVEAVERIEGDPILLKPSIQTATEWKFLPLKMKGQKGKGVTYVAFDFHISAGKEPRVTNVSPYGDWKISPYEKGKEAKDQPQPTPPKRLVRVSSGVAAGQKISGPNPTYPPGARQNRIQGTVVLQGIIDKQGNVSLLEIIDSPALDLSAAAIQAVRDWKYRPYTLQGEPIDVETTIQVNYTLR